MTGGASVGSSANDVGEEVVDRLGGMSCFEGVARRD
jgi:hypothetical protein